jgi:DNA excision repair protein ERCC-3
LKYSVSDDREKFRIASENPEKLKVIELALKKHAQSNILIIGQYIDQLELISEKFKIPLITGKTPLTERQELYSAFRSGKIKSLVVSKVANFSIDLPDANIAIQVSGTFGSRQEEAQRLGRILRPKQNDNTAIFYSLISRDTSEERFGQNRQLFLTEQGYEYEIYTYDQFQTSVEEGLLAAAT